MLLFTNRSFRPDHSYRFVLLVKSLCRSSVWSPSNMTLLQEASSC
jgi:hypothetical protein